MISTDSDKAPDWGMLLETATQQEGLFTTSQAATAGYSSQLLRHHVRAGRLARVQRGIYRVVHFPVGEQADLVAAWLWSDQVGLVSHQTALALHGLSDALPARCHMTLPSAWRRRRLNVPFGITLHHADVPDDDRTWFGAVPVTSPRRTLADCAVSGLGPELLGQAARQALRRGLVGASEVREVEAALRPFGGIHL